MKILWVLENYHPHVGGVETLFKNLAAQLLERGHELVILTSKPTSDLPAKESQPGFQLIRLPFRNRYLFTFLSFPWVYRYAQGVDLVHTTSYNAALPAFLGARLRRKAVLITFHEAWGRLWFRLPFIGRLAARLHYLFEQMLLKLPFDRFIAVSQATATRLAEEGVAQARIQMIYNGLEDHWYDQPHISSTNPKFEFLYLGRLGISKGLDLLLAAVSILAKNHSHFHLQLIVPQKPRHMLTWLKAYIKAHDLASHVSIRHNLPQNELISSLQAADAVVIPSYSEGFCFVAAEAMALGLPVISSEQGALSEVVGGKHIAMRAFSVEALSEAMEAALAENWRYRPQREFRLSEQIGAYQALYKACMKKWVM